MYFLERILSGVFSGRGGALAEPASQRDGLLWLETLELRVMLSAGDLRIVSYNIHDSSTDNTPLSSEPARVTDLATVLQGIGAETTNGVARQIDVLAIQEVTSQATTSELICNALNGLYGAGTYAHGSLNGSSTAGNDTVGLIYKPSTVQLLSEVGIGTPTVAGQPRQAVRYKLRPVGLDASADFYLYNSHYKSGVNPASGGSPGDADRRAVEATAIRTDADTMGQNVNIIYAGDFNTQGSSETGFQTLISAGNGQGFDPLNRLGTWHNNSSYLDILTQAPLVNAATNYTGGGLDDRFDFQLLTGEWTDGTGMEYLGSSYHTFGNNGSVALNGNINDAGSTALGGLANRSTLLNLLSTVSDHLPVVADYHFVTTAVTPSVSFTGGTYVQNFDGLPASGTFSFSGTGPAYLSDAPVSGTSLSAWSITKTAGSSSAVKFDIDDGGATAGSFYSYGTGTGTDRALGSLATSSHEGALGVTLVNNSTSTINNLTLGYTGEQWRNGGSNAASKLAFSYGVNVSSLVTGTFSTATSLDFTSPIVSATAAKLDGNAAANRMAISGSLGSLNWQPGQQLILRWSDANDAGSDDGLAIDDLTLSVTALTTPTVTVTSGDAVYTAQPYVPSTTVTGDATPSLAYTYTGTGATIYASSATAPTGVGTYSVVASYAGSPTQTAAASAAKPFSILPKQLAVSVAVNNKNYDGATTATIASRALTGVIAGDTVTLSGGTAAFADALIGNSKTVAVSGLLVGGASAGNYTVPTSATATASILAVASPVALAQWTFDSTTPDASTSTGASTPSTGAGTASLVGGVSQTYAAGSGTGSDNSGYNTTTYKAQAIGSGTAGVQFAVSTTGISGGTLTLTLDFRQSGSASRYWQLQLSSDGTNFSGPVGGTASLAASQNGTNSGTSFSNNGLYANNPGGGSQNFVTGISYSLSGSAATPYLNNPNFAWRWVAVFDPTGANGNNYIAANAGTTAGYGTGGTARFDNVVVQFTPVFPSSISVAATSRPYTGSPFAASATVTGGSAGGSGSSGVVTYTYYNAPGGTGSVIAAPTAVGSYSVIATVPADSTYGGATSGAVNFDITPKVLAIASASVPDKSYDGTTSAGTPTFVLSGVVAGDSVSASGTAAFADANAGTNKLVNISGIAASNPNYAIASSTTTTATISKASQAITFGTLPTKTYGDAAFTLGATSSNSAGAAITYTSSDPTIASIAGSTVTILQAGSVTITASQAGDGNYNAATDVGQLLTIGKAASAITNTSPTTAIAGSFTPTSTHTGSSGAVTYTYYNGPDGTGSALPGLPTTAGSYSVVATLAADTNYLGATSLPVAFTLTSPFKAGSPTFSNSAPKSFTILETAKATKLNATPDPLLLATIGKAKQTIAYSVSDSRFTFTAAATGGTLSTKGALPAGTYAFTLSATDKADATLTSSLALTVTVTESGPAIAKTAPSAVLDTKTISPFARVVVSNVILDRSLTTTITLDHPGNGVLSVPSTVVLPAGVVFTPNAGTGVYSISGARAADLTKLLAKLVFTPTTNHVAPGQQEATRFTLEVIGLDSSKKATDAATVVTTTSVNDIPKISGAVKGQLLLSDKLTTQPFTGVTIADADVVSLGGANQPLTTTITLDVSAKGTFTSASLTVSGFSRDTLTGAFTFTGTAPATTTAIRQLVFQPTENRVAVGKTEVTTFTISTTDGLVAKPITDKTTTVITTSVNDAPTDVTAAVKPPVTLVDPTTIRVPAVSVKVGTAPAVVLGKAGTAIGQFGATDADLKDVFTYTFVGTSNDNGSFLMTKGALKIGASNLATGTYTVQVQATDLANASTSTKTFRIEIV